MENIKENKRYRSVYKYLRIGAKEYAVLDAESAAERAEDHLNHALNLLREGVTAEVQEEVNKELVLATDFGSKDAPYILALRILDPRVITPYQQEEVAVFLKIAAERGHPEASYRIGSCYAGLSKFPSIMEAGKDYFSNFDNLDRCRLAEHYLMKAIDNDHQEAAEDLIIAYAYGRGYILKNGESFNSLCELLIKRNNQSVIVGYGAWLMGLTVEGKDPLGGAVVVPINYNKAIEYLLLAARGKNLQLAQHALYLICIGIRRGFWAKSLEKIRRTLIKDAFQGNQLLALYLAWYSIPFKERQTMPKLLDDYQLTELTSIIDISEDNAISFLDAAFFGLDEDISAVAKEILSYVFGQCFMNDEGRLVWNKMTNNDKLEDERLLSELDVG